MDFLRAAESEKLVHMTTTATKVLSDRINRIEVSATMAITAEALKMQAAGIDLANFGAGEPHFATPEHIKRAAIEAIEQNFSKYTAVAGVPQVRKAVVERHATDFGSNYTVEECVFTTGGKLALFNAIQVLVDHGDEVIIPAPYWVSFKDIVNYGGGKCVFVETDESKGFALTPEMIERAITPRTKVILLNSPNNPTGAVVSPEDITAIVKMAAERGIYVLSDECYVYLNYSGRLFSAASVKEAREVMIVLGSLSKTYAMTGWRLGYALGPAAIIKQMQKLQSQSTSNPTSIIQKAAVAALTQSQACVAEMREDYIRLRGKIVEGLRAIPGVECHQPDGAFYVFPNISKFFGRGGMNSAADVAGKLLREAHVVTVPGEAFGSPNHIRLSYATSAKEIDRGLERMRIFFGKL